MLHRKTTDTALYRFRRISVRPTTRQDLDYVLRIEHDPENARFVVPWTPAQHRYAVTMSDFAHWIIQAEPQDNAVGYLMLAGLGNRDRNVEFKRLVIEEKGKGYGREALHLVEQVVFTRLRAHRLWLDVMEHNERARRLYHAAGFVEEGILRECLRVDDRYLSLVVMSKLAHEHTEALKAVDMDSLGGMR
ncbi:MAG: GNAT family N-acetyltransferase [Rhodothermales bacterium]